jgi:hypothetical protein
MEKSRMPKQFSPFSRPADSAMAARRTSPVIRASEIGQYAYCRRAWWLGSVYGYTSANQRVLQAGERAHAQHGRMVSASLRWRQAGYILLVASGLLAAFLVCRWLGVAL